MAERLTQVPTSAADNHGSEHQSKATPSWRGSQARSPASYDGGPLAGLAATPVICRAAYGLKLATNY
jgi:hypothetical protein